MAVCVEESEASLLGFQRRTCHFDKHWWFRVKGLGFSV